MKNGDEIQQPKWIKPSMTVEQAARQADLRGCSLKARFNTTMGLMIIAVRRDVKE